MFGDAEFQVPEGFSFIYLANVWYADSVMPEGHFL